ncbi:MAG TPA: hypothetical protein VJ438_01710 [Candidatus Nanoarchaeia archaeon]|nr:hypothetical protein [Candidatus Nanoarchaeia archaeon]
MVTTIQLDNGIKAKLDSLKVHQRETYNEIISRLINGNINTLETASRESLIATIEVLSDPETMRDIAEGLEAYNRGEGTDFEEIKRKLKLNV